MAPPPPPPNGLAYFPRYVDAITGINVWGNFSWEKWYQVQQFWFSSLFSRAHFVSNVESPKFPLFSLISKWMPFWLATVVSSNPFNFVNADYYEWVSGVKNISLFSGEVTLLTLRWVEIKAWHLWWSQSVARRLALQYADPRTPFPCPVSLNANGVGATDTRTGMGIHSDSSNFSNPFACPLNPFTSHSATQWGEECSGVNSLIKKRMFLFKPWICI